MKDNRKGFYKHINSKKTMENLGPLFNGAGDLVMYDREKAEVFDAAFASVITGRTGLQ